MTMRGIKAHALRSERAKQFLHQTDRCGLDSITRQLLVDSPPVTGAQVLEIVGVIALNVFTNFFNHTAGTDVDFEPAVSTKTVAKAA